MHTKTLRTAMRGVLPALASLLFLGRAPAQTYCTPSGSGYEQPICTVVFAGINYSNPVTTPGGANYYVDNTGGTHGNVSGAGTYPITVNANTDGNYTSPIVLFFDWDHDGTFETTVNLGNLTNSNCSNNPGLSGSVTVPASAPTGTARMRVVAQYSSAATDPCGVVNYGQSQDFAINVTAATCLPPSNLLASGITTSSATLGWTASTSNPSGGYQWEVRSSGNPGDPSPVASGTTAGTTASATGLTANTTYTLYVRSDCGAEQSGWSSTAFTTSLGCGSTWISPGGVSNLSSVQSIQTFTICPENPGDQVTINFTTWNGLNYNIPQASRIFIYNGDDTNAPMVSGGNGTAYTNGAWSVPAGGWTDNPSAAHPLPNKPPMFTSTAASGCLTIKVYNYGTWTSNGGWSADITCAPPPTCFAPTNRAVTATTVHGASFSWNAGASPNVEYKVVAGGSPATATAITSGTSANGSATTASVLTGNTPYTAYFRGNCGGGDLSAWSSVGLNFRTRIGCGTDMGLAYAYPGNPQPMDSVQVVCPDNAGDVVTVNFDQFIGSYSNALHMFVHDGNTVNAPLISSGGSTAPNGYPTGGFRLGAQTGGMAVLSASNPFRATNPAGCLTFHYVSTATGQPQAATTIHANITCAPAPACATPFNVQISAIGGTGATVSWAQTGSNYIVEYGPQGFTPGTGASAGTNGVVVANASSPAVLSGLAGVTFYDVYVRQACSGPSYSA
ncbi:MAG: fibronectin type III domain-containing protein, partial [Bacteroidetes bacterium]|nr:fibronectin type III domain-containing protein [Bacteroidota bacterium]